MTTQLATKPRRAALVAPMVTSNTPTVAILTALDAALTTIRQNNPDIPQGLAVVIATGSGKKHGHFAPSSWQDTAGDTAGSARHEILMSSESLARGAELTLTTLIHESVHAMCHNTNVKDTSRGGRYHNAAFRDMAESFGLTTEQSDKFGTMTTGLQDWAREAYAPEIGTLELALTTYRVLVPKAKAAKTTVKVGCDCINYNGSPLTVTVPIKWFDSVDMVCNYCESSLTAV